MRINLKTQIDYANLDPDISVIKVNRQVLLTLYEALEEAELALHNVTKSKHHFNCNSLANEIAGVTLETLRTKIDFTIPGGSK